jgi:hypothetical protein
LRRNYEEKIIFFIICYFFCAAATLDFVTSGYFLAKFFNGFPYISHGTPFLGGSRSRHAERLVRCGIEKTGTLQDGQHIITPP